MFSNRQLFFKYLGQTSDNPYLLEVSNAEGIYLYSPDGKKYIDLISGVSVSNLGHGNAEVKKAVIDQISKYSHLMVYGEYIQSPQVKLAQTLVKMLPDELNNVYFVNSGSEAIEAALKLAKRYTRKNKIISFINAYHGSTHGALSVTGNEELKKSFRPLLPEIYHIEYNSSDYLDIIDKQTACVIAEPIQAEAGIRVPHKKFIRELRDKCHKTDALLIFDEIQTGFGRTGKMFAFEHFNEIPDIICFAKAFGAGMPIGAVAANSEVMKCFQNNPVLGHITTFGGHPVCAAAALAGLNEIRKSNIIENVENKGKLFVKNLINNKKIKDIRGMGLLLAVELQSSDFVRKFVNKAGENGLVTDWFLFDPNSFRIAPPLIITEDEINNACDIINKSLEEI